MGEEKNGQNSQAEQTGQKKEHTQTPILVQILIAVIGAAAIIIGAYIGSQALKTQEVKVILIDTKTKEVISGKVFIDAGQEGFSGTPDSPAIIKLKKENRLIRAESEGYEPAFAPTENIASTVTIEMKKIADIPGGTTPLSLAGWNKWENGPGTVTLSVDASNNECVVRTNGRLPDAAGFNSPSVTTDLRGKTLVLHFSNTQASRYSGNRMVKVECNMDPKKLLRPVGVSTLNDGYIPNGDTPDSGYEFPIPDDFDGKLEFTFYQAELNDLKIAAYYK